MANQSKKLQVTEYSEMLSGKPNLLLVKIDKTSHKTLESLRKELRKSGTTVKVVKNSLMQKALAKLSSERSELAELKKKFFPIRESSALIVFGDNWDQGLKSLYDFTKQEPTVTFKMAVLDKAVYDATGTETIAKLPSRLELIAKIIGSMKSPASKLVYSLKFNTNKFVYVLQAKSKSN